jgi:hypothetical protein
MLERARNSAFQIPPTAWVEERLATVQEVLGRTTERSSAILLRKALGPITLEPTQPDVGRSFYRAKSTLDVLALLEDDAEPDGWDAGSNSLRKWRRGESKP